MQSRPSNDEMDINDIPGGLSKEADLRFFAIALVTASNAPPRSADIPPFTEEDVWNIYDIKTLEAIQASVITLLVDSGYEAAKLRVKWGADDDQVEAPEAIGSILETSAILDATGKFTIWTIDRYINVVQVFPHGPGASGAGPMELWFNPVDLGRPTYPDTVTFVH